MRTVSRVWELPAFGWTEEVRKVGRVCWLFHPSQCKLHESRSAALLKAIFPILRQCFYMLLQFHSITINISWINIIKFVTYVSGRMKYFIINKFIMEWTNWSTNVEHIRHYIHTHICTCKVHQTLGEENLSSPHVKHCILIYFTHHSESWLTWHVLINWIN